MDQVRDIALLMREETLSVVVYRHIISHFDASSIMATFINCVSQVHPSKLEKWINEESSDEKARRHIHSLLLKVLQAEKMPPILCSLCHRSVCVIEDASHSIKRDEGTEPKQWAVASLIFLRWEEIAKRM